MWDNGGLRTAHWEMQMLQSSFEHQLWSLGAGDMHRHTCNYGPRENWEISLGWLVKEGTPVEREEKKKTVLRSRHVR